MDYQKIYDDLINSARLRPNHKWLNGYTEQHHIVPKSMGGTNDSCNLVRLTAREHFIAHWLLWRIHRTSKMAYAFKRMCTGHEQGRRYVPSRGYIVARKAVVEALTGRSPSVATLLKRSIALKGRKLLPRSLETRLKISKKLSGRKIGPMSEEQKVKLSKAMKGRKQTPEHRAKNIAAAKRRSRENYKTSNLARRKCSPDDIIQIKNLRKCGNSYTLIGRMFNVTAFTINKYVHDLHKY